MDIQEIERAINDVDRPMRWQSAEVVARSFLRETLQKWNKLTLSLFAVLKEISDGQSLTYDTVLANSRKMILSDLFEVVKHGNHVHYVEKRGDIKPEELNRLIVQLSNYLNPEQIARIQAIFQTYVPQFFNPDFQGQSGVFNRNLPFVIQDGYDRAAALMNKNARRQGVTLDLPEVYPFSYYAEFVEGFYQSAYDLVTSKISFAAQGQVMNEMVNGFQSGLTWKEISQNIFDKVGTGFMYHWKRLVRTEMTQAYYQAFKQRYTENGVNYVKLSVSIGACPVCVDLDGYYVMGTEPGLTAKTHPNCRCVYLPFWNLPEGASVRT